MRSRDVSKQVAKQQKRTEMLSSPKTPLGLATAMRTRKGGKDAGYLNALSRLQKKTPKQIYSPSCGPRTKDWLRGY